MRRKVTRLFTFFSAIFLAGVVFSESVFARPITGLVLSGGGARGLAHIGVLKALEELSIPVDCITATSMGALVGGGYAAGYKASEIEEITLAINWNRMFSPRPERRELKWRAKQDDDAGLGRNVRLGLTKDGLKAPGGLIPSNELSLFLNRNMSFTDKVKNFADLSIPFRAISTDLLTGKRVVLSEDIALSEAMLASMSVPGAFNPVQYKGMYLCDGCLVDNLPVEEARHMGAKRLIVINVGTPLSGADGLKSIPGIMSQVVNILTEQNVERSLKSISEEDVLIVPDLKDYSARDFDKAKDIIDAGYNAVMENREKLKEFRVNDWSFDAWHQTRKARLQPKHEHHVEKIVVKGNREISTESIINAADIDITKPVNTEDVEQGVRRLWGTDRFEKISYRFDHGEYGDVLILEPHEWEWGQSVIKLGATLQTDFVNEARYSIVGAYTLGALNKWGGEWNIQAQFGNRRYIFTEFFQPLGAGSPWFLRPYAGYEHRFFDVYSASSGDHILSQMRRVSSEIGLDLGFEVARSARIAATIGGKRTSFRARRGSTRSINSTRDGFAAVEFAYDTLDDVDFPKSGAKLAGRFGVMLNNNHDRFYEIAGIIPWAITKDWTVVASGFAGKAIRNEYYTKGGIFSLTGAPHDRYLGQKIISGAVHLSRSVNDILPAPFPVYVGLTAEGARLYNEGGKAWTHNGNRWIGAGSVYLGADTLIGSIFLAVGRTTENSSAISLSWGKVNWW